jgi:hypothetical protein
LDGPIPTFADSLAPAVIEGAILSVVTVAAVSQVYLRLVGSDDEIKLGIGK